MKMLAYFTFIFLVSYSCASKKETCTTTGVVDKVMWGYTRHDVKKNIYFSFIHDYQTYVFKQNFSDIMKLNIGDSVQIQYYCNNPKKAVFVKLIRRQGSEQREETKIITPVATSRKFYHSVDKKPLFSNVQDDTENDKAVDLFIKEQLKKNNVQEHGKLGISIVIDKTGEIVESTILMSTNQKLNDIVLSIIKDMPQWTPAEDKGEKVNVKFLIEIEWL